MPRSPRPATGGIVTHVLNRSNARRPLFEHDGDYELFEHTLEQAHARTSVRIRPCCVMPNHWHLVLRRRGDGDLPEFVRRLTITHTQRRHAAHGTAASGHACQGRYKSFPVRARRPAGRLAGRLGGMGQSAADARAARGPGAVRCPRPAVRQPGVGPAHGRAVGPRIDPPPPRPAEKAGLEPKDDTIKVPDPF